MSGFVVIEGIDGCGKSSVSELLVKRLGKRAVLTREPTDSWIGRSVKKGDQKEISPYTDALLFMADRALHTEEISKLVARGKLVVSDRYYHSTVAYQSASLRRRGLGDNFGWLLDANRRISMQPDMTFLLLVEPDVALRRISGRKEMSRFEKLEFLKEVHRNYLRLAKLDRTIVKVDASGSVENVTGEIEAKIRHRKL